MKFAHSTGGPDIDDCDTDIPASSGCTMDSLDRRIRHRAAAMGVLRTFVVFGSSTQATDDDEGLEGRLLSTAIRHIAAPGVALINGGYMGTMADTASRVRAHGGTAIGVPCGNLSDAVPLNCFNAVIPALDHWERIVALTLVGDAFIVLPGGIGTATEVATLLWNADRGFVRRRPVLFIGEHWRRWFDITVQHEFSLRNRDVLNNFHFATHVSHVDAFFQDFARQGHV